MPATSLASAARNPAEEETTAQWPRLVSRQGAWRRAIWKDAAGLAVARAVGPTRQWLRQGWLYRQSLGGPWPDRILFHPNDIRPRKLDEADAFIRGRFRFAGEKIAFREGSLFDQKMPSQRLAAALHGFDWLRHLELAGGELARVFAVKVTRQWLKRYARYASLPWRPEIIAERFFNLFAHGQFLFDTLGPVAQSRLFVSLRHQAQMLERTLDEAPYGLPRLKAASALALAGLCLGDSRHEAEGLKRLAVEMGQQILPDGGHISRSPAQLLEAIRVLNMVQQALDRLGHLAPPGLRNALDRAVPALRFFRMGDGTLCVFHGGEESDTKAVEAAMQTSDAVGKAATHALHSAFRRFAAGRSVILFDIGAPPPPPFSRNGHAGCLSFEMSSGAHRIIVNCGAAPETQLEGALRSTSAHSTCTLGNISSARILGEGFFGRLLGPLLVEGPAAVQTRESESPQGLTIEASHDGYVSRFGVIHQRRLTVSPRGRTLSGADRLVPVAANSSRHENTPFAIRFHVHPDVRLSLAHGGDSVILKLPNGEGWRFRCAGALSIEASIYFGSGTARRAEQIVISGLLGDDVVECAWTLDQMGQA